MAQAKQDMGSGSVKKLMLQLMIPAVVAQVVNLLYNIVDRIYIGHIAGIGAAALTGVGLTFTPSYAAERVRHAGGRGRRAQHRHCAGTGRQGAGGEDHLQQLCSRLASLLCGATVSVLRRAAPTLLRLFGASDATLPYARVTAHLHSGLGVSCCWVLGMNPFITTQGFAGTGKHKIIGAVINIILDPILIFGLGLGVQGAAIATVLSQAVGAVWILHFLTGKKTILRLRKDYMRPEKKVILPVMAPSVSHLCDDVH